MMDIFWQCVGGAILVLAVGVFFLMLGGAVWLIDKGGKRQPRPSQPDQYTYYKYETKPQESEKTKAN